MTVSYDVFMEAFLDKITEYEFLKLDEFDRDAIVDGYLRRTMAQFTEVSAVDFSNRNDGRRCFEIADDVTQDELDEIIEIVSEGMVVQWFKKHLYHQENLLNLLNSSDFSAYSPAELTYRITNAYHRCKHDFTARVREYSYRHSDLTELHI